MPKLSKSNTHRCKLKGYCWFISVLWFNFSFRFLISFLSFFPTFSNFHVPFNCLEFLRRHCFSKFGLCLLLLYLFGELDSSASFAPKSSGFKIRRFGSLLLVNNGWLIFTYVVSDTSGNFNRENTRCQHFSITAFRFPKHFDFVDVKHLLQLFHECQNIDFSTSWRLHLNFHVIISENIWIVRLWNKSTYSGTRRYNIH